MVPLHHVVLSKTYETETSQGDNDNGRVSFIDPYHSEDFTVLKKTGFDRRLNGVRRLRPHRRPHPLTVGSQSGSPNVKVPDDGSRYITGTMKV